MSDIIVDYKGNEIKVGSRCIYGAPDPGQEADYMVTITKISEVDADYDDELGRGVMINPYIYFKFDDGTEEKCSTSLTTRYTWADYPDGPDPLTFEADDLEVYVEQKV